MLRSMRTLELSLEYNGEASKPGFQVKATTIRSNIKLPSELSLRGVV